MDKPAITNIDYIKSSLANIKHNSDININQINELISIMDEVSKRVILPIVTIQQKLKLLISQHTGNYTAFKSKVDEGLSQLGELNEDLNGTTMTISNIPNNKSTTEEHNKLVNLFEAITNNIRLFEELFKTNEYNKIITSFNQIITDEDIFEPIEDINKFEKEIKFKKIQKKKKKLTSIKNTKGLNQSNKKEKSKKKDKSKEKDKNNEKDNDEDEDSSKAKSSKKKGKADNELLESIQKEYPTSLYIQKLSITFLRRRLFKKVIYLHHFTFNADQTITEEKLKSSGDSTIYKYGKFTFNFDNQLTQKQSTSFISSFDGNLKHSFAQSDLSMKTITIAGKIKLALNDLLNQVFRDNKIYKEHNVTFIKIEFYEFYEELVSEFNTKDKNIKIKCEDKTLKQLIEDWKGLVTVREFVKEHRNFES